MTTPMWVNGTANTPQGNEAEYVNEPRAKRAVHLLTNTRLGKRLQTLEEGFKEIQAKLDFVARVVGETVSMQAKAG